MRIRSPDIAAPRTSATEACSSAVAQPEAAFGGEFLHEFPFEMAAAYLLPRAEAALHQEMQRLADAVKRAREGQSSSSSGWRAL